MRTHSAPGSNRCAYCGALLAPTEASRVTSILGHTIKTVTRCVDKVGCRKRIREAAERGMKERP